MRSVHPIYKVPRLIMFSNQFAQFPDGFNKDYPFQKKICKGRRIEIGKRILIS